jgi:hypothetical protein
MLAPRPLRKRRVTMRDPVVPACLASTARRLSAVLLAALLLHAPEARTAPPALLVVDPPPSGPGATAEILALRNRLAVAWDLRGPGDLPSVAVPDPGCAAGSPVGAAIASDVDEGMRRFYEDTDLAGAVEAFDRALDALGRTPCALAGRPEDRARLVAGSLLRIRIAMQAGPAERANERARRVCGLIGDDEVARADVPPDVRAYVEGVRTGLHAAAASLRVTPVADRGAPATGLLVDGIPLDGAASLPVTPGDHVVSVVPAPGGDVRSLRVRVPPGGLAVALDLDLSRALEPGDGFWTLRAGEAVDATRIAAGVGIPVLLARRDATGWRVDVAPAAPGGFAGEALRAAPHPSRADALAAIVRGPRALRRASPWPWVSGAAAAGLLAGGVALNVLANRDADAINGGTNRLDDRRDRRAGAIACYALSGAAALTAVVLAVVRPAARETLAVVPVEGGAAIGLGTTF